ncbi:2-alkenal reductase (NADP(+)-dependent) [Ananas comosus]|uniref:2-alkenal reductase (NADP(+)-dependent) n=1 Tax=Ananas comosus TaxID=4615 RepID=A0A199VAM9_ANACO|nr:2-alkenal reductase (NADP(+)-dependent) [Ananas comosus]
MAEAAEVSNTKVVFKGFIEGAPKEENMEVAVGAAALKVPAAAAAAAEGGGAVLVKNLYLSCDPYMRGRMRENYNSYIPPFQPGSVSESPAPFVFVDLVMRLRFDPGLGLNFGFLGFGVLGVVEGFGVSRVVDSTNPNFRVGDLVSGLTGWEEYSLVVKADQLRKIQVDDVPLSYHQTQLGAGMPGFTAYAGFYEVCSPKKGDFVFVSAASGAVGQLVGQLAKLHGCYVVGSAGTNEKVELLKNKLGFDEAFNYKESDLNLALKRYFPQGIDIYFDNVGGEMLDAALLNMRLHGRIAVCGMISYHGASETTGIRNLFCLITKRVRMQGFLQSDYLHLLPEFLDRMAGYYREGKIVYIEDMSHGLENAPAAFVGLFSGKNVGKKVVCVSRE